MKVQQVTLGEEAAPVGDLLERLSSQPQMENCSINYKHSGKSPEFSYLQLALAIKSQVSKNVSKY